MASTSTLAAQVGTRESPLGLKYMAAYMLLRNGAGGGRPSTDDVRNLLANHTPAGAAAIDELLLEATVAQLHANVENAPHSRAGEVAASAAGKRTTVRKSPARSLFVDWTPTANLAARAPAVLAFLLAAARQCPFVLTSDSVRQRARDRYRLFNRCWESLESETERRRLAPPIDVALVWTLRTVAFLPEEEREPSYLLPEFDAAMRGSPGQWWSLSTDPDDVEFTNEIWERERAGGDFAAVGHLGDVVGATNETATSVDATAFEADDSTVAKVGTAWLSGIETRWKAGLGAPVREFLAALSSAGAEAFWGDQVDAYCKFMALCARATPLPFALYSYAYTDIPPSIQLVYVAHRMDPDAFVHDVTTAFATRRRTRTSVTAVARDLTAVVLKNGAAVPPPTHRRMFTSDIGTDWEMAFTDSIGSSLWRHAVVEAVDGSLRQDPLAVLPPEVIEAVLLNLNPLDLLACRLVSRAWKEAASDRPVWDRQVAVEQLIGEVKVIAQTSLFQDRIEAYNRRLASRVSGQGAGTYPPLPPLLVDYAAAAADLRGWTTGRKTAEDIASGVSFEADAGRVRIVFDDDTYSDEDLGFSLFD